MPIVIHELVVTAHVRDQKSDKRKSTHRDNSFALSANDRAQLIREISEAVIKQIERKQER
uniref:DUF5908 family protein n=1 Tax=Ningiella ruwaisensis TaxID=2364274 RepID=UPI003BA97A21